MMMHKYDYDKHVCELFYSVFNRINLYILF